MPTSPPPTSSGSLTGAVFTGVVDRHQNALYTFLSHLVGDAEQAYDLLQDTFYDAWRATQKNAAPFVAGIDEEQMRRWLFHVAYCKGVAVLRRRRLIRWESFDLLLRFAREPEIDAPSFEDHLIESEVLRTALAQLTPQDRACILLQVAHGLSAAEVGQIMGTSAGVVRKRLSRAKQRLRALYLAQHARSEE